MRRNQGLITDFKDLVTDLFESRHRKKKIFEEKVEFVTGFV